MMFTYELVCHETKQKIWVGQGRQEMTIFYSGEEKVMERLRRFLATTKGKPLILLCTDNDSGDWEDYEEFEDDSSDTD